MTKQRLNTILAALVLAFGLFLPVLSRADTITYGYDARGRVTSAAYPDGTTITYAYDAAGNRTSRTIGGAVVALDWADVYGVGCPTAEGANPAVSITGYPVATTFRVESSNGFFGRDISVVRNGSITRLTNAAHTFTASNGVTIAFSASVSNAPWSTTLSVYNNANGALIDTFEIVLDACGGI